MRVEELIAFAKKHSDEDPLKLVLQQGRYPEMDMRRVAQQIEGMRQASTKWPTLASCEGVLYPPKINREQSSSEATAQFKAELLKRKMGVSMADLTGGMGIDSMAFASVAEHVDYVELVGELCRIMEHNCDTLGLCNVSVHCGDSIEWLRRCGRHFDVIFADPARRDSHGRKVAAFEDCLPNILEHRALLAERCDILMVKASPMMDIDMGTAQLGNVSEVHVVAVKGECKELLFICGGEPKETTIHTHNLTDEGGRQSHFAFTRREEANTEAHFCKNLGRYLYEPDAALMKSGCYKLLCRDGQLLKLDRNTHLYTSNELVEWSGRVFEVHDEVALNKKTVAAVIPEGKAHVAVRNYPTEAAELQKKLGLKEGGTYFVIATTIRGVKKGVVATMLQHT